MQLTSIDVIYQALRQTTARTGLRVVCEVAQKKYAAGVKAHPEFLADAPTLRDKTLSVYNYYYSADLE